MLTAEELDAFETEWDKALGGSGTRFTRGSLGYAVGTLLAAGVPFRSIVDYLEACWTVGWEPEVRRRQSEAS